MYQLPQEEYLKPDHCPICGDRLVIGSNFRSVNILLNDNSIMLQPVCKGHLTLMETYSIQVIMLRVCRDLWEKEINESPNRSPQDKKRELKRIRKLRVINQDER